MAITAPSVVELDRANVVDREANIRNFTRDPTGADILRIPMSLAEFDDLQIEGKAEWVDGVAYIMPHAKFIHAFIASLINDMLRDAGLPLIRVFDTDYRFPGRVRVPDLMLIPHPPVSDYVTDAEAPVIAVEILSPSTRSEDFGRKAVEYADTGVFQYWVVDPQAQTIWVRQNTGGEWQTIAVIGQDHPNATITVGEYGSVNLDWETIFRSSAR